MSAKVPFNVNGGHKADANRRFTRYDIWDNRTDRVIGIGLTAVEAAELLGVKVHTIYNYVARLNRGELRRWHIERYFQDEKGGDSSDD